MKLTQPQLDLLMALPTTASDTYKPAITLVALGLAEWRTGRFGDTLVETSAGACLRQALTKPLSAEDLTC